MAKHLLREVLQLKSLISLGVCYLVVYRRQTNAQRWQLEKADDQIQGISS